MADNENNERLEKVIKETNKEEKKQDDLEQKDKLPEKKKNNTKKSKKEAKKEKKEKEEVKEQTSEEKKEQIEDKTIEKELKEEKDKEKVEKKEDKEKLNSNEKKEEKPKKNKKKRNVVLLVISIILICIVLFVSVIFALLNINNEKIVSGISIMGIDVSNLTQDEARNKLNEIVDKKLESNIEMQYEDYNVTINANEFGAKFDIDTAVAEAYNIGRDGNIVKNNYAIVFSSIFKKNIDSNLYYDDGLYEKKINDIASKLPDSVVEASYYIEDDELIIVSGKAGNSIKKDELKENILNSIKNINESYKVMEIPVEKVDPQPIDLNKIRNEIYKEPKDAYVEKDPIKVHTEVDGVDFGISIEEAEKLLEEDKKEYTIPLKITPAEKTLADLGEEAFPEQLSTFQTIYDASNYNRSTNITLASKKVNGTIVMPGEEFSFNKVVGKRTLEAGFKEGTAYVGGKVVPDVGGGICQLSSTLYNTALLANLEIVERSNHIFETSYVAASRDATVYWGTLDFVFKNNRSYPIKIVAESSNGVCKVSIYGIKEEEEYEVVIQSKILSYIPYTTEYIEDPTLAEGKEVIEQYGHDGCKSEAYKILKKNGKVVSETLLSKDTYSAMERIVRIGTKKN